MINWGNILYQESSTASSDMNVINDIYKKASKFRYGVPVLNDFHTEGLEDISFMIKNYHFLSPDQVVKHNGGICYDHANYIRNELEKNKVKYRFIFIQIYSHGNGVLFHGFIIAYPNDYEGSVYIETAAGNNNGIFKEKDDNTVIKRVFNMMDKTLKSFANKNDIKIDHDAIDITNCIPKPGTSYMEFYENAYNKGKMIHSEIKQKEEYEKQKSVQIQESVTHGEMIKEDDYCCESVNWKDPSSIDTKLLLSSKTKELLKKYTDDPKNPYFDYRNETRKKYGELPKDIFDNLSALVKLVFKSKEYKEYKKFLDILCSAVGYDNNFAFMRNIGRNGDILLEYQKIGQKRPMTPTLRLFHTSNNPNLKELAPKFKSVSNDEVDGHQYEMVEAIWPEPRVYFGYNTVVSRLGGDIKNDAHPERYFNGEQSYCYEYTGSKSLINGIFNDMELRGGNAVYVNTDKPLPVKRITYEEYKNAIKQESFSFDDIEDDYFIESAISYDKTINVCKELYDRWSNFGYGIPINGNLVFVPSAEYFEKNYRFLSPDDFEKYGGGVCWDFVEWGAKFLRSKGIQFHQYYLQTDTPPNYDTHTFIICHCGDKFVYPECAFSLIASDLNGVGTFNSLPEIYNYIASKMFECNGNRERFKEFKFSVQEYTQTPNYGCTCKEYTNFMKEHARLVFEGVAHPIDHVNGRDALMSKYQEFYVQESKLSTSKRNELKDSEFGIPEKRTFPLNDKNHVEAAVRMFPHADDSDKKELAKRIIRKAHEFGMDTSKWESLNKYIQEADMSSITLSDIPYTTATAGYKPTAVNESDVNPFALFDKVPLNDFIINRYKSKTDDMAIGLKHLRMNDRTKGFMWLNQQDEVVGYVAVEQQDIGPFIIALELSPKYQGRGLGKALLEFAENYLGGRYLSVSKKNERAFEMYKSCGWNVYDETPKMYFMKKDDNFVQPGQHKPMYFYHMIDKNISLDDKGLKTPDYVLKVEHNEELYLKMTDKYRNRLVSPDGWNIYPDKQPDELTADEIYNGINSFRGDSRGNNQIYMFRYPPTKELGPNMRAVLDTKDIYAFDINDPNNSKYINNINWGFDGSFTGNKPLSKDWYENISQDDYFSKYDDNGKMLFASLNHISIDPTLGYLPLSCLKKIDSDIQPVVQEGAWQDIKHGVNPKSKKLFFHISMDTKMNGKTLKPRIPTYLTKKDNVTTYKEDATIPRVCFSPSIEGCLNAIISAQKNLDVVGKNIFVYIPEKPISEYKIKTNKEIIKEKLVFDANATGEMWILEPVKLKLYGVIMVDQVKNIREKPTINGDPHGRCDYKWHWAVTPKYVDRTLEYQETYDNDSKKKKTTKE